MPEAQDVEGIFQRLGATFEAGGSGEVLESKNPATGTTLGRARATSRAEYEARVGAALERFDEWRARPAPKRGELVRRLGELLREHKEPLGELVSLETGKIRSEGLGEVQEMIDICDFAVGLSRQLHGLTIASERPGHRMMEQWHPVGPVGVISAFNFPVAVWSWNATLALVCGNSCVWKPSEKAPLTALAVQALFDRAGRQFGANGGTVPEGLSTLILGGRTVGAVLVDHTSVPLVS